MKKVLFLLFCVAVILTTPACKSLTCKKVAKEAPATSAPITLPEAPVDKTAAM